MKLFAFPQFVWLLVILCVPFAASPSHAAAPGSLPVLSIRWGCGQCAHNDKAVARNAYAQLAAAR